MITKNLFGKTDTNQDVFLYTLSNKNSVTVEILTLGGIIKSIQMPDKDNAISEVSLGFDSLARYQKNRPYFGAIIGRFAGRIKGARFNLNGKEYHLEKNDKNNHLHGGAVGFNKRVWDSEVIGDKLLLSYLSPDLEENYPGNLQVKVAYSLDDENRLSIEYFATTDADTILNLTNHAYFNLSGENDILNHTIQIDADRIIPIDREYIPTGGVLDVSATPFDLRAPAKIGERIILPHEQFKKACGFDQDFIINKNDINNPCCTLYSEKSGRMLEVFTTCPCVHLYTGNFLKGKKAPFRGGLCLETQGYSDAMNNPNFPSPILRAGETFKSKTIYKFNVISGR